MMRNHGPAPRDDQPARPVHEQEVAALGETSDQVWLRTALGRVAGEEQPTTQLQALRDLSVARRALRRRRAMQGFGAVAAVCAALIPLALHLTPTGVGGDVVVTPASPDRVPTSVQPTVTPTPTSRPTLVLHADGVSVVTVTGSKVAVKFGRSTRAEIEGVLGEVGAGDPTATRQPDCGQGPRTQLSWDRFSVLLHGTRFVGWLDQGEGSTSEGVRIGVKLEQLRRWLPGLEAVSESLGPEWTSSSGLGGALDGTRPTSRVTMIWAGETCFFR